MTTLEGTKVLIIDDDPSIRRLLVNTFSQAGAETVAAVDGSEGLRILFAERPDLIILDIMMPDKTGWEICAQIRELTSTPIIMLTSLNEEEVTVRALDGGAVDFMSKPFRPRVLLARARAALRQAAPQPQSESNADYRDEYLHVALDSRQVYVQGEHVHLTKTEFKLLAYLLRHARQVLTFDQILQHVWGIGYEDSIDYVHGYVSRLRRKLEPDPKEPRYLVSVHGVGYRFQT